jgi:hypothetical protein
MTERDLALIEIWTFRRDLPTGGVDVTGYSVEATDGGIGKIDEATYESGGSYIVVDTGPWIFGKKVMLPAGVIRHIDPDEQTVHVSRSKDEIKNAPELDGTDEDEHRRRIGDYYAGMEPSSDRPEIRADRAARTG